MRYFNGDAESLMCDCPHVLMWVEALLARLDGWAAKPVRGPLLVNEPVKKTEILAALRSLKELSVSTTAVCLPLSIANPFGNVPSWITGLEDGRTVHELLNQAVTSTMDNLLDGRYQHHLEDGLPMEFRRNVIGPVLHIMDPPHLTMMQGRQLKILRRVTTLYVAAGYRHNHSVVMGFEKFLDLLPRAIILGVRKKPNEEQTWTYAVA